MPTIVGYFDADLATPVAELERLLAVIGKDPQLEAVLASRVALLGHSIQRKPTRHYLGRLYATAASLALGVAVYDTQCGAKLFRVNDDAAGGARRRRSPTAGRSTSSCWRACCTRRRA